MTEKELEIFNQIHSRIIQLEEEVYALFEAQGKIINPVKRIIETISRTKHKDYDHQCFIELSLEDIRLLQDARLKELKTLRTILKEDDKP